MLQKSIMEVATGNRILEKWRKSGMRYLNSLDLVAPKIQLIKIGRFWHHTAHT